MFMGLVSMQRKIVSVRGLGLGVTRDKGLGVGGIQRKDRAHRCS